jgi:lipopolysaccharide export system permease protein
MSNFNKKLIFKKFLIDNTYFFLLTTLSLSLIVWVIQAVNFLDFVSEDGHSLKVYFLYTLLNFPKIFSKLMPIMFFISLYYSINKYDEKNELKIFWINGISQINFVNTLIKYTFLFFILQIMLNLFVIPLSQNKARSFIKTSNLDFFPSLIKERKFIDTVDKLIIYIEERDSSTQYRNIFIKNEMAATQSKIIYAQKGNLIENDNQRSFRLFNGKLINVSKNKITTFNFKETNFDLSNFFTKSITHRKIQERNSFEIISCVYNFYLKKITYNNLEIDCTEEAIQETTQEAYKRIIKPIYFFVIICSVCFLLIGFRENFKYKYNKFFVFLLGLFVLIFSEISVNFSGKNSFQSGVALVLPSIFFLIFYFSLIKKLSFTENKIK